MATYQGVMAGIGDKPNNINVIHPQFDATLRQFIVGGDTILQGLDLNGNTLSSGFCICQGYVGELANPIILDETKYIYGKFTVHHSGEDDSFEIETYSTPQPFNSDDILNGAGTAYITLYRNGNKVQPLPYPANSVSSENTDLINDNGEIGNNVECPTQPINDNSLKVANTEYVHKQIEEEIGYGGFPVYLTTKTRIFFEIKANFVIGTISTNIDVPGATTHLTEFTIPERYAPIETQRFVVQIRNAADNYFFYGYIIEANSTTVSQDTSAGSITAGIPLSANYCLGWKAKT